MKKISNAIVLGFVLVLFTGCSGWPHRWFHDYGIIDSRDVIKPESAPKLIEALNDQNPKVRIAAMRCLLKINRADYIEPIEHVAQADQDEKVRSYALRVASKLRETSKKNIIYNPVKLLIDDKLILITVQSKFTFYTGYKDEAMVWKAGLLPIEIKLINLSDTHIRVDPNFCNLISPGGTNSKPLSYEKIIEKMQFSYKGGVISTVLFAPVGIGQLAKNKKINDKIRSHVGGAMLSRGSTVIGIFLLLNLRNQLILFPATGS